MVHLNGEMARDYVKGEFSAMQGSAGMPLLRKWDVYKKGRTSVFILYHSSFIITIVCTHREYPIRSQFSTISSILLYFCRVRTNPTRVRAHNSYIPDLTVPYRTLPIHVIP